MCSVVGPIFFVEFLVEPDVTSTGCVAFSVAFCCLLRIALSCVVVMLCVVTCLLLVTLVCWLKISQLSCSFVARLDATTRRTYNSSTSTRRLNKQNFHCVFSAGKHRFLRGGFVITTYFLCAFSCPG